MKYKLKYLETAFMAFFCDTILDIFQATSIMLQKSDNILTAVSLLESLRAFVSTQRDQFEMYEKAALNVTGVLHTYNLQRSRKQKTFGDEGSEPK